MRHEVDPPHTTPSLTIDQAADLGRQLSDLRIIWSVIDTYYPNLPPDDAKPITGRLTFHLAQLRAAFPNLNELRDKDVVDIACGSRCYPDNTKKQYEPWMSRLLLHLGAIPFGVDLAAQQGETFHWRQADLTVPDALGILESNSFDAAYICAFPTRKAIRHLDSKGLSWPAMRENILSHVRRALTPEGVIIRSFTQADEDLVRRELMPEPPQIPPQQTPLHKQPNYPPRYYFDDDEYLL
jgi:hypothetical protein